MSGDAHAEEGHADERWLITYADMITLLMVLFIVLFSMSQLDLDKYRKLKESLSSGFGGQAAVLDGGTGALDNAQFTNAAPAQPSAVSRVGSGGGKDGIKTLEQARVALASALNGSGLGASVTLRLEQRGLVVSIVSDRVLFEPGEAGLRDEGRQIVDRLGPVLSDLPNPLSVEGHTDNVPISGPFPSNWELSTARASSVLRELVARDRIDARRFTVTGYADQRPVTSNATAAGRAANRRVELVVLAMPAPSAPVGTAPATPIPTPVPMPVPNPIGGN